MLLSAFAALHHPTPPRTCEVKPPHSWSHVSLDEEYCHE